MNDLRTAAQQALEAWDGGDTEWFKRAYTVVEALRAALAEPVQEPVAWFYQNMYTEQEYLVWKKGTGGRNWRPLYVAPPQRKPLTEEEITQCFADAGITIKGQHWVNAVRNVERAHGITP